MNVLNPNIVILLTAAIKPNSQDVLTVSDPKVRKQQYMEAINFYLTKTDLNIVFAENSGTSIEKVFRTNPRLEFLTFTSPLIKPDKGKGYKELEIIDHAMKNSNFIAGANFVVKITGRLKVLNINQLLRKIFEKEDWAEKLVLSNIYKEFKMDSRCFCYTKNFWWSLKEHGKNIDLAFSFERALWMAVSEYNSQNSGFYEQFSQPLRIQGVSGGHGIAYKHGFFITLAKKIRHHYNEMKYSSHFKN